VTRGAAEARLPASAAAKVHRAEPEEEFTASSSPELLPHSTEAPPAATAGAESTGEVPLAGRLHRSAPVSADSASREPLLDRKRAEPEAAAAERGAGRGTKNC
jgi:hypothetical protein